MQTNIYNQEVQDVKKIIDKVLEGENSENTRNKIFIAWGKITADKVNLNEDELEKILLDSNMYNCAKMNGKICLNYRRNFNWGMDGVVGIKITEIQSMIN